ADRDAATGAVLFGGSVDPTWHGRVALVDANGVECAGAGRLLEGPAALVAFAPRGGAWLAGTGYRRHWSDIDPLQEHDWFGVVVVLADGSSRELRGHSDYLTSASWSPDGEQVLTTSEDRTAMVWSIHDAAAALPVILRHEKTVDHGRFLPDGERILTGMSSHEAALWDRQGHKLSNLRGHVSGAVAIGVVGDGDQLLTASMDKRLLLWDGRSRWCEAWRTGGKVAAAGYEAGEGLVWSLTTGGLLQRWRRGARLPASSVDLSDHLQPHERMLSAVTWSKGLAIVTSNHRLLQFDTSGVRELWRSPQGADVASSVPVLPPVPHGRHLLVATAEQSLLDVAGGRDWGQLPAPPRGNLCWVASQPRGSRIAAGTDWASVAVWRTDRPGEPPVVTEGLGSTVMGVAWNVRDGGLFIATRDGLVIAFDENLTERWRQDLRGYLFRLFAAPDGSSVAVLCNDQRVRVLTADGELCLVLPAMDGRLRSCQFSADGRRLLVATYEGDLREWPLLLQASGREILSVETSPYREALEAAAKREERK
ncbi:MAG: WD40 repeat domain-containing protein, partial [Planctomycetes bacterium]|nr:WD40 repeat domain-containing protein [Planctomycetota bacterium]